MSQVLSGPSPSLLGLSQWFLEDLPASCLLSITSCPLWNVTQPRTPPSDASLIPWYHLNAFADSEGLEESCQVQYCVSHVSHHLFHSLDPYLLQYYEGDNQNGETVRTKWWGGQSYRLRDQRWAHWGGDICAGTFGGWPYGEVGRTVHWNTEVHIWRPFGNTELTFWKDLTELLWWLRC